MFCYTCMFNYVGTKETFLKDFFGPSFQFLWKIVSVIWKWFRQKTKFFNREVAFSNLSLPKISRLKFTSQFRRSNSIFRYPVTRVTWYLKWNMISDNWEVNSLSKETKQIGNWQQKDKFIINYKQTWQIDTEGDNIASNSNSFKYIYLLFSYLYFVCFQGFQGKRTKSKIWILHKMDIKASEPCLGLSKLSKFFWRHCRKNEARKWK